ncbi:MAG TPA: PilT/PilU family type 4a pilus ATPase [Fimbriimonadaceae bacterium]|nr:PilT/PilU family type 4a pilus ATPase [Fimbriimonadaceae bacterium]
MSEAFDWSRVLKTDDNPAKASAKEVPAPTPAPAEETVENKTPLELVPGGATDSEPTAAQAEPPTVKIETAAPTSAEEPPLRTVDVLDKPPTKTLEEIQAEYANRDLFAPKRDSADGNGKPVHDLSAPAVEEMAPANAETEVELELASEDLETQDDTMEAEAPLFDVIEATAPDDETSAESEDLKAELFGPATPATEPEIPTAEAMDFDEEEEEEEYVEDLVDHEAENLEPDLPQEESPAMDVFARSSAPEPLPSDDYAFKDFEEETPKKDMSKHYRPAELPENIFDIPLTTNKFDVGSEIASLSDEVEILEDVTPIQDVHLDDILRCAIERKASDIHFTVGLPPMARIDGEVAALPFSICEAADTRRIVYDVLSDEHVQKFEQTHELDFGYGVSGLGRFRFNVYMQRGSVAGALRAIPTKIPSFEDLGLPSVIRDISKRTSGLVLVTGPTGSGKSTTIASMIDDINLQRTNHIITIEDPIEYLHPHKKCMVNQRELHGDTYSFHNALRAVLREDPDIILVGELRDLETIEAALTLAETGHLVFGTLHTRNAPSTIDRVIDVFPSDQQDQIRVLLGNTLEGVVSQQLLPRLGGGRCAAIEIMIGTPAIKNLIREGKTHQMYSVLETSANIGMQTMDASLSTLFRNGYCSYDECMMRAVDKETFARLAKGG